MVRLVVLAFLTSKKTAFPGNYTVEKGRISIGDFILDYKLHNRVPRDPLLEADVIVNREKYFRVIELSTSIHLTLSLADSGIIEKSVSKQ